jgi:hypothetical protein
LAIKVILSQCIERWRRQNIPLGAPIPESEISRVWDSNGYLLSDDVRTLYSTVGGFAEWVYVEDFFWCLWPWNHVVQENRKRAGTGMRFCDHSIGVVTWELRFEDHVNSSVWITDIQSAQQIAPNLEAFFCMYLENPFQLL